MRTILVFGGTSTVGFEIVKICARLSYNVVFTYNSSFERAQNCIHSLKEKFPDLSFDIHHFDALDNYQREKCVQELFQNHCNISSVFYNSSLFFYDKIENHKTDDLNKSMDIHVKCPLLILKAFKAYVVKNKIENPSVIHMIDSRVVNLTPHFCSYTLGKSSLWTLTQTAAREFIPDIRVNAVGLGPMTQGEKQTIEQFHQQLESLPLKKKPSFEDLFKAIDCLLHCQSLTGQMLYLDSGMSLGWQFPDQKKPRFF
ncbi:MAG: hypothetical protein C0432_01650 [Candidatus Puniceispirillum sp.]|nr:hypothetical protein [Candidatus Pelagibacter sp.]MBA4282981.1 hypothetical protein [Candidatus Puniceispirillum sp.]